MDVEVIRNRQLQSRATIAQDAGKAIHPSYVEGQIAHRERARWALNEEYIYDDKGTATRLPDYRMTCLTCRRSETKSSRLQV